MLTSFVSFSNQYCFLLKIFVRGLLSLSLNPSASSDTHTYEIIAANSHKAREMDDICRLTHRACLTQLSSVGGES